MFIWAKVPQTVENVEQYLDNILYEKGIFITPGKIFGSNGDRFIRLSLCVNKEDIIEAIKRISE
jgi:aspartate/methionine/tyrosine aminotransferase